MKKDFVQILHNGEDHWFTISTLGLPSGHVNIYDSLYQTCTDHAIDQICMLHALFSPLTINAVHLHFIDVEKQTNSSDCGLYAGYAVVKMYVPNKYDTMVMRQHLLRSLESGIKNVTAFPSSDRENRRIVGQ